jgi:dTDP-4-amino-4,6-dideoxygalactose transaminase
VDDATAARLVEVYRSRAWSFDKPVERALSKRFAEMHGARHGIVMANGTVTLQAALIALGVRPGDEVIVPALTWLATAMAVHYVGAKPVFADIDPSTLCLDAASAEAAITRRTRAIIPVHLYGSMADLDAILAVASRHDLAVVEDCAHAHGSAWAGRGAGSWGHVGSFSFQQSKTVASGEGGICITSDDRLAETLFRVKHIGYAPGAAQGMSPSGPPQGLACHNFRATEFQAVILEGQLDALSRRIQRYNAAADRLTRRVSELTDSGLRVQARGRRAAPQGYYTFTMIADGPGVLRDIPMPLIRKALAAEGISMGGGYGPVYRHLLWSLRPQDYRIAGGTCPVADGPAQSRCLMIQHQWLSSDNATLDAIGDALAKVVRHAERLKTMAAAEA